MTRILGDHVPHTLLALLESIADHPPIADIFGSGDASGVVARQWLDKYRTDDASALADLINCILQCAGCDLEVTVDDIRDPENIPNRLVDLQSVYQEVWRAVITVHTVVLTLE